ncbi:MAG: protein kinase [Deltaproteobacteria bacterium]|nr:protein kinase [Deltaproteobacteria bacterium]
MDDNSDTESIASRTTPQGPGEAPTMLSQRFIAATEIGRGGMGVVFRCRDVELGRDVAIKVLKGVGTELRSQLTREARLQSRLQHPSIIPVYDIERSANGNELIVMREIAGQTLRAILRKRAMARRGLLSALSRVCMAIDYAHTRKVVHRDLKPENVMMGEFGEVYVVDWGLAIELDAEVQSIGGTPGYTAPEQLEGRATELSDVFSLGKILFEILDPGDLQDAPPELLAIATRACSDDAAARPTARELADVIDRFLDGERDLALRKQLAADAADAARAALATADRRVAMREVGRALALDPDHGDARSVLRDLLTAPPAQLPPEVDEWTSRERGRAIRGAVSAASLGFILTVALLPLEAMMGVRSPGWFVTRAALAVSAIVACRLLARQARPTRAGLAVTFTLSIATISCTSLVAGPFILIPSLAVLVAASLASLGGRRWIVMTTLIGLVMIGVPFMFEYLGVVAPSYTLGDDMVIHPRLIDLPPTLAPIYFVIKEAIIIAVVGMMLARFRDTLAAAERALAVHAWQLSQLLPSKT